MGKSILVFSAWRNAAAMQAKQKLVAWLKKKRLTVIDVSDVDDEIPASKTKDVILGVTFGGDGTFLRLVRRLQKKDQFPILGINLGSLGFITQTKKDEFLPVIETVLKGRLKEDLRPLLLVELIRGGKKIESGMVFNDAVITKDARTTMLKLDVYVGGEFLNYVRADGYIASTPTGSTAYALSAGGPMLHPELKGIVLAPICSHSLSARPFVVPEHHSVEVRARDWNGTAYLVYDGLINYEIHPKDVIRIQNSGTSLRLLQASRESWFEALRTKLSMA